MTFGEQPDNQVVDHGCAVHEKCNSGTSLLSLAAAPAYDSPGRHLAEAARPSRRGQRHDGNQSLADSLEQLGLAERRVDAADIPSRRTTPPFQ